MPSLEAAHKGYFYQDLATAYFLARSLVEAVESTTVDTKYHSADRFDDLLVAGSDGKKVRRQFKHSDLPLAFERSSLTSDRYDLRLDLLIESWLSDPAKVRAIEYRVCVTWRFPLLNEDRRLLKQSPATSSFADQSRCFQLDADVVWPKRQQPLFNCLRNVKRSDFVTFAKRLVIELECPSASRDLDHPGPLEQLLLGVLSNRVGFGRYPNQQRGPVEAAAQLVLLASRARGSDRQHSTLSPAQVAAELGLVTDYGRIAQQFPFKADVFVSIPDLRRKLLEKVKAGGITIVSGGPGAGKSWELTDLMRKLRARNTIVAAHYCYLEPGDPLVQSRITLNAFYGNLIAEIIDAVPELREHNSTRYAAGPRELQALLDAAGAMKPARRLVVIVDGLDHIARVLRDARELAPVDTQIARDLLALNLPKNVSVLVGSQPGDHIAELARAGTVLTVPAWDEPEVDTFLRRIPLGKKLRAIRIRGEDRNKLVSELESRSQGNALYCTYLCRELEARMKDSPGVPPLTLLRDLPANDGKLSTYYEFLLGSLDAGGRLVGELMGLIDFGVTPEELQEVFPLLRGRIDQILTQLAPILERTRGQGGLRIYHESFRRHLLEKLAGQPGSLGATLMYVIAWLDGKGFFTDPRAFRFLLPNLIRAERGTEVFGLIGRDFVVKAVAEGHPSAAIGSNLRLFARVAADACDFPSLIRAGELARALRTFEDNLSDCYEYGTTYAAIFGADRLSERLSFDGVPTFKISDGLKLCSLCADAGSSPPWHAYLRKPRDTEQQRDIGAEMAHFHGRVQTGEGDRLRKRLLQFLSDAGDEEDWEYLESLARRWAEVAGADDLRRLQKESKCNGAIAEILDLEFARRSSNTRKRIAAASRVARNTTSARRAIEALKLGADPKLLTRWTNNLDKYEIGIGGRGIGGSDSLSQWFLGIRIAAFVRPSVLVAEEARIRGEGWYRNWLAFVIKLARIERRSLSLNYDEFGDVVDALSELASDVHPFKGSPRACDLYYARRTIHESFGIALGFLQTAGQWRRGIKLLKKISSGTTTSLDRSKSGPLTANALVELVSPFANRSDLQALIRRELEPLVQGQHHSGIYNEIASDEMALASLMITMGDHPAALDHWKRACLYLCAYGMRKDITIYEILDNIQALRRAGKREILERLAKLLPMVYTVVQHTDGRETRHSIGIWFKELFATDELVAASLLGRSMSDDGGSYDYRIEEGLIHWINKASTLDIRLRCRLEHLIEGPTDAEETKERLARIELLRKQDITAADLEFQMLAAAVHGDHTKYPKGSYEAVLDYSKETGFVLPIGGPEISRPEEEERRSTLPKEPRLRRLRWKSPRTPLALLRRFQEVLPQREYSSGQLLAYCQTAVVSWADNHRLEVDEILMYIARADPFSDRAELLSGLGGALESAGKVELAVRALTLAFAGHRGGGGWLSFGDEGHEDLFLRAIKMSRPLALAVLAQEMAHRNGNWGVTRHVVDFLGRHDDVALAMAMWDEARESMLVRLPGNETAQGPFLPLEPSNEPNWVHDDAGVFLILARISHPECRRKTAAICAAAWLVQRNPVKCVAAFREVLNTSLCFTHQLWLLQLLWQFESTPFLISKAIAGELNAFVGSGHCGTEQLALMLLRRAEVVVTGHVIRNKPVVSVVPSQTKQEGILSIDPYGVAFKIEELWPDFPEIVAARFQTIFESDESHEQRMKSRWEASQPTFRKTHPWANLHKWEAELYAESLHEVITGLEEYMWSEGEWVDGIWPNILSLLLQNAEIPARHYWSRRVRPSWPLPSTLSEGARTVQSVPDGELVGWLRIAYFETYRDCEDSFSEIKLQTRATAGVVLDHESPSYPKGVLPLRMGDDRAWVSRFPALVSLNGIRDTLAGHSYFGVPFEFHELLGLIPSLAAALELRPRLGLGPMDLFDKEGNHAVAYRWWRCRPLGDHKFAEENPRLFGGNLLMRPDLFAKVVSATKLSAFEMVAISSDDSEQLKAKHADH